MYVLKMFPALLLQFVGSIFTIVLVSFQPVIFSVFPSPCLYSVISMLDSRDDPCTRKCLKIIWNLLLMQTVTYKCFIRSVLLFA